MSSETPTPAKPNIAEIAADVWSHYKRKHITQNQIAVVEREIKTQYAHKHPNRRYLRSLIQRREELMRQM